MQVEKIAFMPKQRKLTERIESFVAMRRFLLGSAYAENISNAAKAAQINPLARAEQWEFTRKCLITPCEAEIFRIMIDKRPRIPYN